MAPTWGHGGDSDNAQREIHRTAWGRRRLDRCRRCVTVPERWGRRPRPRESRHVSGEGGGQGVLGVWPDLDGPPRLQSTSRQHRECSGSVTGACLKVACWCRGGGKRKATETLGENVVATEI